MKRLFTQLDIDRTISEKIPSVLQSFCLRLVSDAKDVFGAELSSVIIYGSVATAEYIHKKSNINVVILVNLIDIDTLNKAKRLIKRWLAHRVNILLLTPEYVKTSLDSFPIEFLDIKTAHVCIFGQDYFDDVSIDSERLRLQCEHELKGKFLKLRQFFLEDKIPLAVLLADSCTALMPVFKGLVKLKGKDVKSRKDILDALCREYGLSQNVFNDILQMRTLSKSVPISQMALLFDALLMQLERLIIQVDVLTAG